MCWGVKTGTPCFFVPCKRCLACLVIWHSGIVAHRERGIGGCHTQMPPIGLEGDLQVSTSQRWSVIALAKCGGLLAIPCKRSLRTLRFSAWWISFCFSHVEDCTHVVRWILKGMREATSFGRKANRLCLCHAHSGAHRPFLTACICENIKRKKTAPVHTVRPCFALHVC